MVFWAMLVSASETRSLLVYILEPQVFLFFYVCANEHMEHQSSSRPQLQCYLHSRSTPLCGLKVTHHSSSRNRSLYSLGQAQKVTVRIAIQY